METLPDKRQTSDLTVQDKETAKTVMLDRLNKHHVSRRICSHLIQQRYGTRFTEATQDQLQSTWTLIVDLLGFKTTEVQAVYLSTVKLTHWLKQNYKTLTIEELLNAYDALVMRELTNDDDTPMIAYPELNPRSVGAVLAANRRSMSTSEELKKVISKGLHLPEVKEPTKEEIDAQMYKRYQEAIEVVRIGANYFDLGNGLYTWLYKQGIFTPSDEEFNAVIPEAKRRINENLSSTAKALKPVMSLQDKEYYSQNETLKRQIQNQLKGSMNENADWKLRVRQEAFRILLFNHLLEVAGVCHINSGDLPTTPVLKSTPEPKPYSHAEYMKDLSETIESMPQSELIELGKRARATNTLDVFELAKTEWKRRESLNLTEHVQNAD